MLPGISRQTVIELAAELGIPCREADLDLYDAYAADEAFLTSTSLCMCPVRSINGMQVGGEEVFGPVTQRLIDALCASSSTATSSSQYRQASAVAMAQLRYGSGRCGVDASAAGGATPATLGAIGSKRKGRT